MRVTFEMETEQVDAILKQELAWHLESFRESMTEREDDIVALKTDGHTNSLAIFEHDPIKDVAILREHIRAFELVLDYYGFNKES